MIWKPGRSENFGVWSMGHGVWGMGYAVWGMVFGVLGLGEKKDMSVKLGVGVWENKNTCHGRIGVWGLGRNLTLILKRTNSIQADHATSKPQNPKPIFICFDNDLFL